MVTPSLILPRQPDERWQQAKQLGVDSVVVHTLEIGDNQSQWTYDELRAMQNWFVDAGLTIDVIEGSVPIPDRVRLGEEGRDADIAEFKQFLRDCGDVGIPVVCYDWMAGTRWARTEAHLESRGGSYVTGFDTDKLGSPDHREAADVTAEQLWEALEYFLEEVTPVAEEAGVKLGLHPDDPPRESLGDMPRIINSPEAYQRVVDSYDSEYNGITFCQGNFAAMGVDIPETIERFGEKINFIHFRDVEGDRNRFVETWHDNGPTDMFAAMRAYEKHVDDDVPMRPDHVPTMAGEDNSNPGYHMLGRLFAIGYMRGLREGSQALEN
ncbi:mannonate dehydratase [Natronolimnobius baerhuensis]|uniref:mannonate dehydratase n=1 Tax=Natronolimnobius baerhuensis TaxID=253108 RepID=A0A202EAD9_9EURY|nr:mannonate dehydratase [Natronolimnobius baerhuensis]OVE85128.1 mannonate dehydratase [Natronolimnobius baerhuensis]